MIEFAVLGPLRVCRHGEPIVLGAGMQRRLLAVLLCRAGETVSAAVLADAIWAGEPPQTGRKTLQVYVHRLRVALGEEHRIRHDPAGYAVVVEPGELDAARFADLLTQAREARQAGDLSKAAALFRQALLLWRGAPYADLADVPALVEEARRLEEQRLLAVEERIAVDLDLGRHAEGVAELTGLVNTYPYRERLRAYLMLSLYRAGRQVEALEAYRQGHSLLAEELGVEPEPALQRLHEAVLRNDAELNRLPTSELGGPREVAPRTGDPVEIADAEPVTAVPAPRQLPADATHFTGRRPVLDALDSLLATRRGDGGEAGPTVALITGPAGVGKTAVAIHWAHRMSARFPGGQLHIDLRGFDARHAPLDPAPVLGRFLRGLGVPASEVPADADERSALYRTLIADRQVLVLLDNAASAEQVRPLLPGTSAAPVLVTSRNTLAGLVARDGAHPVPLDVLTPGESVTLLEEVIGRHRVAAEPAHAAELTRLCGHLPLALRIVASNLAMRSDSAISTTVLDLRDGDRLAALEVPNDETTAVRHAFAVSLRSLTARQRRTFIRLGMHPGPHFDRYAGAALAAVTAAEAERIMAELASHNLLERPSPDRFRFHDLVRDFARAVADEPFPVQRQAVHRWLDYLLTAASSADATIYPTGRRSGFVVDNPPADVPDLSQHETAIAWMESERVNLAAAVSLAAADEWPDHAWRLALAMWRFLHLAGYTEDWISIFETALTAVAGRGGPGEEAVLNGLGNAFIKAGRYDSAVDIHLRCLAAAQERGEAAAVARSHANLGVAYERLGRYEECLAQYEKARIIHGQLGNRLGEGSIRNQMAIVQLLLGRLTQAQDNLLSFLPVALEEGNLLDVGIVRNNLGRAYRLLGQFDEALECLCKALAIARQSGDRHTQGLVEADIAGVYRDLGRYDTALDHHQRAYELIRQGGLMGDRCMVLNDIGDTYRAASHPAQALTHYEQALALARQIGERYEQGRALAGMARVHKATDSAAAHWHLNGALAILSDLRVPEADEVRRELAALERSSAPS